MSQSALATMTTTESLTVAPTTVKRRTRQSHTDVFNSLLAEPTLDHLDSVEASVEDLIFVYQRALAATDSED
jgi:hypothetical protein